MMGISLTNVRGVFIIAVAVASAYICFRSSIAPISTAVTPQHDVAMAPDDATGDPEAPLIEDLMYKHRSDKSRDDHGYTKLYHMLFSDLRHSVKNMTEVGIAAGQSLQAWYRYFPNAEIHAFDVRWFHEKVKDNVESMKPRVHAHIIDLLENPYPAHVAKLGFEYESMDIIIEDSLHFPHVQQDFLIMLFPFLKPGGFYIIEDVGYDQEGVLYFRDDPSKLRDEAREILESHDTIFVDTHVGHRAWAAYQKISGPQFAKDHVNHNCYLLIIQKREVPLRQPAQINYGNGAMKPQFLLMEDGVV